MIEAFEKKCITLQGCLSIVNISNKLKYIYIYFESWIINIYWDLSESCIIFSNTIYNQYLMINRFCDKFFFKDLKLESSRAVAALVICQVIATKLTTAKIIEIRIWERLRERKWQMCVFPPPMPCFFYFFICYCCTWANYYSYYITSK